MRILFGCLLALACGAASARSLALAAAADLQFAMVEVAAAFEHAHPGLHLTVTYGSSGAFFAQIQNGARFDLFLSADMAYPEKLAQAGLAEPASLCRYSRGQLVVWVPKASPIPVEALGLRALTHPAARRIAMANPRHAPYGRAAEAALATAGLLEALRPRLVFGENITQAAQFVQSGAADVGILALSLALAPPMVASEGRYRILPPDSYPALNQGAVVLRSAHNPAEARAFLAFLQSPGGRAILRRYGFLVEGS